MRPGLLGARAAHPPRPRRSSTLLLRRPDRTFLCLRRGRDDGVLVIGAHLRSLPLPAPRPSRGSSSACSTSRPPLRQPDRKIGTRCTHPLCPTDDLTRATHSVGMVRFRTGEICGGSLGARQHSSDTFVLCTMRCPVGERGIALAPTRSPPRPITPSPFVRSASWARRRAHRGDRQRNADATSSRWRG